MIGGVIAVLVCVWFYYSAEKLGINPLPWIVGALIVYYGAKIGWISGVVKPVLGGSFRDLGMLAGFLVEFSGALAGVGAAALFRSKVLLKQQPQPQP